MDSKTFEIVLGSCLGILFVICALFVAVLFMRRAGRKEKEETPGAGFAHMAQPTEILKYAPHETNSQGTFTRLIDIEQPPVGFDKNRGDRVLGYGPSSDGDGCGDWTGKPKSVCPVRRDC